MTASVTVRHYLSTMTGASSLFTGQPGSFISLLDTYITGFGSVNLTSLSVTSGVATATVNAGHGFTLTGGYVGPVIRIAGTSVSALNTDWRIDSIPNSTTFTFIATGITDQSATSGTAKIAPLPGWIKLYSGTNLAVYQRTTSGLTPMLLRVDDTNATYSILTMYESMTDVNTGTGASSNVYLYKSATANATTRPFRLIADPGMILFFNNASSVWEGGIQFGDVASYMINDGYSCMLGGSPTASGTFQLTNINGDATAFYLSRSYTQIGAAITAPRYSHRKCDYAGYNTSIMQLPINPASNKIHLWPIEVWESTGYARGIIPGVYNPLNALGDGMVVPGINGNPMLFQQSYEAARRLAIDLIGPWR